jgi:hypothetical protein
MEVVGRKFCVPSAGSCCAFTSLQGVGASVCWCGAMRYCAVYRKLVVMCLVVDVVRGCPGVRKLASRCKGSLHRQGSCSNQPESAITHLSPASSLPPGPILGDTSPRLAPFLYSLLLPRSDTPSFCIHPHLSLLCLFPTFLPLSTY